MGNGEEATEVLLTFRERCGKEWRAGALVSDLVATSGEPPLSLKDLEADPSQFSITGFKVILR